MGSVPSQGTKIPYAMEQLSPRATTKTWCSQRGKKDLSWLVCSSGLFTVPQHFVCPPKLCHGKSGEHPAIQSVAPADSDLGSPPVLPLTSPSRPPPSLCANSSWTARKHDFGKGKPFQDFKTFMNCLFHIKSCFCCTKFIDVQFYYMLPSEKKKSQK